MKRLFAFLSKRPALALVPVFAFLLTPSVASAQSVAGWVGALVEGAAAATVLAPVAVMAYAMFTVVNFILWIAGMLFNVAVVLTVFQFATYFGNTQGIQAAWTVLRDLGNIVLLFGFIFMGLGTVLNLHEYTIKKALPGFIIFAILLNFSLFASQAVIDVANVLSSSFYAQAMDEGGGCTDQSADDFLPCINDGIAGKVMQVSGVASAYNLNIVGRYFEDPIQTIIGFFALSVFSAIAATVLFAGAIMFIFRAVVLVFLMVLSPIGFAGMAVPPLQKLANDWWQALIKNAFFAPVYILLVLVALKVAEGLVANTGAGGGLAGAIQNGGVGAGQMFLTFSLITGFMAFALVGAQKLGAVGAGFATKTAGGVALGGIGFVGRRTLGAYSNSMANRIRSSKFGESELGRFTAGIADKGARASYSVRGAAPFKALGVDVGKPNKAASHGYHGIEEAEAKKRVDYAKTLKGRIETQKEYQERLPMAQEQAAAALKTKNDASSRLQDISNAAEKQQEKVNFLKEQEKANPNDAGIKARIDQAQVELAKQLEQRVEAEKELAKSEKALTDAQSNLEFGKKVSKEEQQDQYADHLERGAHGAMEYRGSGVLKKIYTLDKKAGNFKVTLGEHVKEAAAQKIRKTRGMDELESAFETMKKKIKDAEKANAGTANHAPAAAPASKPATKPAGGGGDHAHPH